MHTNYYFLRQLAPALEPHLVGLKFMECFSQDRDELVLVFAQARGKINYYKPFFIKATLRPDFSGLLFPETVQRARTNSVNLFESLVGEEGAGRAVKAVTSFLNERCLAIRLEDDFTLLFKFFGNRPNLLAFQGNEVVDLFNQNLATDNQLLLSTMDRPIDQSYQAFERAGYTYRPLFPTFGKVVNDYIGQQQQRLGIDSATEPDRLWALVQETVRELSEPRYYLTRFNYKPALSLLPIDGPDPEVPVRVFDDPIEAANRFFIAYNGLNTFEREKAELLRLLDKRRRRAAAQIEATMQRLIAREEGVSHEEMGHILMANLHDIPEGQGGRSPERITLYDFYRDQPVTLKLKPDLSPQKNAENFYRKAKNEKIEEEHLTGQVADREAELVRIDQYKQALTDIRTLKELRRFIKQHHLMASETGAVDDEAAPLFKEVLVDGFRILIGRNARNNDLLTQKFSYKDDLWLHARDVSGSHVLIKYRAGKPFPKTVIERAAELAAWYSKRRTDSLCPVIVTPKKYVRKPKGLAEGQVVVEKEDVVLVEPRG
ncbi:NFACT RNA binding domain-containing protein [Spirosoma sordidisoli]|uniref:DUF814 domain-containing protein n=1 Tax=Spirosoma sordidisoli TaxID=2502893 RepID=A0A4Q2UFG0_9BACT|nr:NFACT RNA binding domain-containing protein [Spirosoma sordidisoli]RYC67987.1 DUF814 domain-containing protein [Spirosoma sordidisoli]